MFVKGLLFGFILGSLSMAVVWYAYDYGRDLAYSAGNHKRNGQIIHYDEQD